MKSALIRVAGFALLLGAPLGCVTYGHTHSLSDGNLVAKQTDAEGASVEYRLRSAAGDDDIKLVRDRHVTEKRIDLPLTVSDLDRDRAAALGVEPWKGVYVERVKSETGLGNSGLRKGDVLIAINDIEFNNARQFRETAAEKLKGAESLKLSIVRIEEGNPPTRTPLALDATPDRRDVHDTVRDSFSLTTSKAIAQHTGLMLAELTPELAKEVYGDDRSTIVVADVILGSPGYLAGFRKGDRLMQFDGKPVAPIATLEANLLAKGADAGNPTVSLVAEGMLGSHTASVEVLPRLDRHNEFTFPILVCWSKDTSEFEWGFLQFIFLFGGRYERKYLDSGTREIAMRSDLEVLPLGLFELERDVHESEVRVLWFITHRWSDE